MQSQQLFGDQVVIFGNSLEFFLACLRETVDNWLSGVNSSSESDLYGVGCDGFQIGCPAQSGEYSNQGSRRTFAVVSELSRLIVKWQQVVILWPVAEIIKNNLIYAMPREL